MENKVLVVDDEMGIRDIIREYLELEGFHVIEAVDGADALNKFISNEISFVILDIMIPKLDGWKVCRKIRENSTVPIIMLSARGEEYDKLFGFELGVDDYMVKPFSPKELMARMKAILSRSEKKTEKKEENNCLTIEGVTVDFDARTVFIDGEMKNMTPKEYDVFAFLISNQNKVFSREQLLDQIWGYDFFGDVRTVDTHVKMVRENLGKYRSWVKTVWGIGYKFEIEKTP